MELRGIATALYDKAEKTVVSVTALTSESADRIFIERTQKAHIDPSKVGEVRDAFMLVLDEVSKQRAQIYSLPGKRAQIPIAVAYGMPKQHPEAVYRSMIQKAFPGYLPENEMNGVSAIDQLEKLFLAYHAEHGQPGSVIELKAHGLFLSHEEDLLKKRRISEGEIQSGKHLDRLHEFAESGDTIARDWLEFFAREEARRYVNDCIRDGVPPPRFVHHGLNSEDYRIPMYTFLEWYNLKDVFVDELVKYIGKPHNICVKTPNDKPSPPFADIAATHIADYWDIIEGRQKKRHVFARHSR